MATFTFTTIDFSTTPVGIQSVTVEYKIWSDTSYTLVDSTVDVNTDGTLVSPLTIPGLTSGEVYNIKVTNNCSSPSEFYVQTITA